MSPPSISPNIESRLAYLYALQRRGIKLGLDHSLALLQECGNPQTSLKAIHIAGTNGKGSTAAMIASILKRHGYTVGLYTSPHLVRFNERIRVDGVPIPDAAVTVFIDRYQSVFDSLESTFFEATSAMAFWYFRKKEVDVAVVETGLGGRLDSTNVLSPELTVITSISLDHQDLLGTTLDSIALEKAGILKRKVPLILAPQQSSALAAVMDRTKELGISVFPVLNEDVIVDSLGESGTIFQWKGGNYTTALIGGHQAYNAAVALEAVRQFSPSVTDAEQREGLKNVHWPGRLQKLDQGMPIFYDVAHNANGVYHVLKTLRKIYGASPASVMALKSDKDVVLIARELQGRVADLGLIHLEGLGLMSTSSLAETLSSQGLTSIRFTDMEEARSWLISRTLEGVPGLIFGSHYLAESIFRTFNYSFDMVSI